VFTCSIHAERNFPFVKETSDLDVALPDGTQDPEYLEALQGALGAAFGRARPDFVLYLSGADPYAGDRLGKLCLSKRGLARRDRMVLEACRRRGLPVAVTMGGGYAEPIEDTVDIAFNTVREAAALGRAARLRAPSRAA
jgi:acetoin utilization deacetylase AcuC-like enzyme